MSMLSVVSIFVVNLVFPLCILRPIFKLSSFMMFNWCSILLTPSVVKATSSTNLRSNNLSPSIFIPLSFSWAFFLRTPRIDDVNNLRKLGLHALHLSVLEFSLRLDYLIMYSCSSYCVNIFWNSNLSFVYTYISQYLKYCFMFHGVKCFFIVNVSDAKGSFEFITCFYQLIDCLKMINCQVTFSETNLFSWLVFIKGFFHLFLLYPCEQSVHVGK